jgi:hypothetical protein
MHAATNAFKDHLNGGIRSFIDAAYILTGAGSNIKLLETCAKKNDFHNRFVLFMNIFPEFFPKKYIPDFKNIPPGLVKKSRYLIYNFKYIQNIDYHQLMLQREYRGLKRLRKFLFLIKRIEINPAVLAKTYNCNIHSPMLIFYYFHRINAYFLKFISFLKTSKQNSLSRRLGVCQKMIDNYLQGN